jgi:hypothetical protein
LAGFLLEDSSTFFKVTPACNSEAEAGLKADFGFSGLEADVTDVTDATDATDVTDATDCFLLPGFRF